MTTTTMADVANPAGKYGYKLRDGVITSPGRYEGEPWYVVVLAEEWEGRGDETVYDGDVPLDIWTVTPEMRRAFELDPDCAYLALSYTNEGFAQVDHLTEHEYLIGVAALEAQGEETEAE